MRRGDVGVLIMDGWRPGRTGLMDEDVMFFGEFVEADAATAAWDAGEATDGDGQRHLVAAGEGAVFDDAADLSTKFTAGRRCDEGAATAAEAQLTFPFPAPAPEARDPGLEAARILLQKQSTKRHNDAPSNSRWSRRRCRSSSCRSPRSHTSSNIGRSTGTSGTNVSRKEESEGRTSSSSMTSPKRWASG